MGRPRKYDTDAERQRAFRQRRTQEVVVVERRAWEQLHLRLDHLHTAIHAAAQAGDATARACCAVSIETTLEKLIRHFRALSPEKGGSAAEGAP